MSELLSQAASKLGVPEPLIQRSAAARAGANGTAVEDVLAAWAGGDAVSAAPAAPTVEEETGTVETTPREELETEAAAEAPAPPGSPPAPPQPVAPVVTAAAAEPVRPLAPVPLRVRARTAIRVGSWTGAALGIFGFLMATIWAAPNATVIGEGPYAPVIQVSPNLVVVGAALLSVLFGAVIASLSRSAASWVNPGMELSNSPASTAWLGAFVGLILGVVGGAVLTGGFGTPVEGEEVMVQLPVLATIVVITLGGALLGGTTAAVTQTIGVPVAVPEDEEEEVEEVRHRLRVAFGVPATALTLLALLVLPFAYALIQSNEVTTGGAAIVGVLTAAGILAFASLAGTKPNIRISFGEAMVAVIGIGLVLLLVIAVLFARDGEAEVNEPEAATVVWVS